MHLCNEMVPNTLIPHGPCIMTTHALTRVHGQLALPNCPHVSRTSQALVKMGKADETVDVQFVEQKENFKMLDKQYDKITKDVEAVLRTLKGILEISRCTAFLVPSPSSSCSPLVSLSLSLVLFVCIDTSFKQTNIQRTCTGTSTNLSRYEWSVRYRTCNAL